MPILALLGQGLMWFAGAMVARWVVVKLFVIGCLVTVVPWVLKDGVSWFWDVTESQRAALSTYTNNLLQQLLSGIDPNIIINITSIGGYIANQIGLADYASILVTAWGICWGYKIGSRFL